MFIFVLVHNDIACQVSPDTLCCTLRTSLRNTLQRILATMRKATYRASQCLANTCKVLVIISNLTQSKGIYIKAQITCTFMLKNLRISNACNMLTPPWNATCLNVQQFMFIKCIIRLNTFTSKSVVLYKYKTISVLNTVVYANNTTVKYNGFTVMQITGVNK